VFESGYGNGFPKEAVMETAIAIDPRSAGAKAMQAATPRRRPSHAGFKTKVEERQAFDGQGFLDSARVATKVVQYDEKEIVCSQGDPATSVLYIQNGGLKLTVVNEAGKEAVVAILGPGEFFGEACLAGQPQRLITATTITRSTILVIEKLEMIRLLHAERAFCDRFIKRVLSRTIRVEQDLIDQLFNSSEKRLARALLLLARYGEKGQRQRLLPKVSQETLAEMIGTTRSRVNFFMNKFRKLGFIEYNDGIHINDSLLNIVLHD
jgi:CRP/FNR family transcriptional regulator, cyclic AMP receptor protein